MAAGVENQQKSNGKLLGGCTGKGFMPGKSGNPAGRPPKGRCVTDIIREMLDQEIEGKTIARHLAETGVNEARDGNVQFWKEVIERLEGKVPDKVMSDGKLEVTVNIVEQPIRYANDSHN